MAKIYYYNNLKYSMMMMLVIILQQSWAVSCQIGSIPESRSAVEAVEVRLTKIFQAISQQALHFNNIIGQIPVDNINNIKYYNIRKPIRI